ncbi:hypothetical protein OfM1_17630 [Lactovum odontotermitis]
MATKQQWREYFKLMNNREPSLEEFQAAIEKGEIEDMAPSAPAPAVTEQSAAAQPNPTAPQPFLPRQNTAVPTSDHHVGIFESYKLFWKNYVNFTGRSRRSEFWWTYLINSVISIIIFVPGLIIIFASLFAMVGGLGGHYGYLDDSSISGVIVGSLLTLIPIILFGLAVLIPSLAIFFRRLRDTGLGTMNIVALIVFYAALYIFSFIPVFGFLFGIAMLALAVYFIVLEVRETDYYKNRTEPITDWFAKLFKK